MSKANKRPQEPPGPAYPRTALENPPQEDDPEQNKALHSMMRENLMDHLFALVKEYQRRMATWQKRQTRLKAEKSPGTKSAPAAIHLRLLETLGLWSLHDCLQRVQATCSCHPLMDLLRTPPARPGAICTASSPASRVDHGENVYLTGSDSFGRPLPGPNRADHVEDFSRANWFWQFWQLQTGP